MLDKYLRYLKMRWEVFKYNYGWHDYVGLFDGWVARCSMVIPILGYLIIFNDYIATHFTFNFLSKESQLAFGLGPGARLKFIYFGLALLGSANVLYRIRRPHVMSIGRNESEYVNRALRDFVLDTYIHIHGEIRHEGHRTMQGKYYDSEYRDFLEMAKGVHGQANPTDNVRSDWRGAKDKYEGMLRSMLIEYYFRGKTERRTALTICIALALAGYALLIVPSADLFIKVVAMSF